MKLEKLKKSTQVVINKVLQIDVVLSVSALNMCWKCLPVTHKLKFSSVSKKLNSTCSLSLSVGCDRHPTWESFLKIISCRCTKLLSESLVHFLQWWNHIITECINTDCVDLCFWDHQIWILFFTTTVRCIFLPVSHENVSFSSNKQTKGIIVNSSRSQTYLVSMVTRSLDPENNILHLTSGPDCVEFFPAPNF